MVRVAEGEQGDRFCDVFLQQPCSVRIKDLAYCKQRFDSHQKPLGRFLIWLEAVLMTSVWVSVNRKNTVEQEVADEFLAWINEEKLVQLAMCADGGDDSLCFTRFLDSEGFDVSEIPSEIHIYVNKLNSQFLQGNCVKTGYTKHVLDILKKSRGYFVQNQPFTLGGPGRVSPAMIERCMKRMACWVKLAINVIDAEYPSYQLLHSFLVFDLTRKAQTRRDLDADYATFRAEFAFKLSEAQHCCFLC